MQIQRHKNKKLLTNKKQWNHTGSFPHKHHIPKPRKKSFFKVGDLVGFIRRYTGYSGKIKYYSYNKQNDIIYTIEVGDYYKPIDITAFEWELFMKPLTRDVIIEKKGYVLKSEKSENSKKSEWKVISGTTNIDYVFTFDSNAWYTK